MNTTSAAAPAGRRRRRWIIVATALLLLLVTLLAAWRVALHQLRQQVLAALGPEATLRELRVAWPGVIVVDGLELAAPKGWPSKQTLRAERVDVVPALRSLATEHAVVDHVVIKGAYLSVRRTPDGKLELLPTLIERARRRPKEAAEQTGGGRSVTLDRITLRDAMVDFHDASLRGRNGAAVSLQLVDVDARIEDLKLPELDRRSTLELRGRIPANRRPASAANGKDPDEPRDRDAAAQQDGSLAVKGWLRVATRESSLELSLKDVDLVTLEPYLIKRSETGVKRGRLSLDMRSEVRERRLHAPGRLVLDDLHLKSGGGLRATFMGMPRDAVVAALKRGGDRIELDFTLEGELDNARFSLNETLATRVAVGMAQSLGIGFVDIIKDVGGFGAEALDATGDAIGKLFGKGDKNDKDAAGP